MLVASALSALTLNTILSFFLGAIWYSYSGFGKLWIVNCFGSMVNYEANKFKTNDEKTLGVTLLTTVLYNALLIFIVNYVHAPNDFKDVIFMSMFIVMIHAVLEMSHIGYELRNYTTLFIHAAFHMVITVVSISMLKFYFQMPLNAF